MNIHHLDVVYVHLYKCVFFVFFPLFLIWQGLHSYFVSLTRSHTLVVNYYLWFGHFAVALHRFTHWLREIISEIILLFLLNPFRYFKSFLNYYYSFYILQTTRTKKNEISVIHSVGARKAILRWALGNNRFSFQIHALCYGFWQGNVWFTTSWSDETDKWLSYPSYICVVKLL